MQDSFQIFTKASVSFARRDFGSIAFLVANDFGVLLTSYVHEKMEPPFQSTQQQTSNVTNELFLSATC